MIHETVGDITILRDTIGDDIVCHCVNDLGIAGSGVIMAIEQKWPESIAAYRKYFKQYKQGSCQLIEVEKKINGGRIFVANLFAQSGIGNYHGLPAIRYGALEESFLRIKYEYMKDMSYPTLHLPEIGCGRAGGKINIVKSILRRVFSEDRHPIILYRGYDGKFK